MALRWRMDRTAAATRLMHVAAADALNTAAEHLLEEANRTVPIEEATLKRSGTVEPATPFDLRASVAYGGEASAYAVKQHEDTTLRHDAGRRPKWLEMAFKENAARVRGWLAGEMRRGLP